MVAHLEAGDLVCVFPEGTRSRDRSVGAFRGGALLAARLARVPIVPAAVGGTFDAWPRGGRLRLAPVSLAFGEPLDPLASEPDLVRERIVALAARGRSPSAERPAS
jgi:1-acyl-sn-glycerol-3-phosphate acyltransferase